MGKYSKLLLGLFLNSFFRCVRESVVPLLCGLLLLFSANCTLTASDLQYSHQDTPIVQICDKPLDVPDGLKLWGFNYTTKQLVTEEDPAELRLFDSADAFFEYNPDAPLSSASKMPREYGLTCVKPSTSYSQWTPLPSSTDLPSSSELFRSNELCSAKVAETVGRPNPRWLGVVGKAKKPQQIVHVCARPPGVPQPNADGTGGADKWTTRDVKGDLLTASDKVFTDAAAQAEIIFVYDANVLPITLCWFKDPEKLSCPDQRTPKDCNQDVKAALVNMAAMTSLCAAGTTDPKKVDEGLQFGVPSTSTSSPYGDGPPLNFAEVLSHNLSILGALASGNASANIKDPNGARYGMAGGKNVGGPNLLVLQAAVGVFAIIGVPFKSGKEFIQKVTTALSEKKVAAIVDTKVLSKEIAEQLAAEPGKKELSAALDALKHGDKKPLESLESFGKAMAPSLRDAAVIMPYSRAKIFTKGWQGEFQAHHILEVDMMGKLKMGAAEDAPAIILSKEQHEAITKALNEARDELLARTGKQLPDKQELWAIYKKVYAGNPAWLEAIKSYFQ